MYKRQLQGGHGAIAGGANIFPRLFVDFYQAAVDGDTAKVEFFRQIVLKIYQTIYNVGSFSSRFTVGTKSALAMLGICNDYVARPLRNFENGERENMTQYIEEIKEMLSKATFT